MLLGLVGTALLAVLPGEASAQDGRAPEGPIEITVGSSAGSTPDVLMRRAAKILNDKGIVTNPIVVQNRTGGSWAVATNHVLSRPGDKNTLMSIAEPVFSTPIVQGFKNAYDQLTPLGIFVQGDLVVLLQPNHQAASLKDLMEMARQRPKSIKIAGASVGSTDSMASGLLEKAGNVKFNYIPYDGGSAAQASFLGGNVDMIVLTPDEALPLARGGKGKIVAILTAKRSEASELKDIPTAKEQGFDVEWGQIFGVSGAPNLDPALVAWWQDKLARMVETEEWQSMLKSSHYRGEYVQGGALKGYLDEHYKRRLAILRELGVAKQ